MSAKNVVSFAVLLRPETAALVEKQRVAQGFVSRSEFLRKLVLDGLRGVTLESVA